MKEFRKLGDLPKRPWKDLSPDAQQLYLAAYRRTWEKCQAGGVTDKRELARRAHEAAMLAVEQKFETDEPGRSPTGGDFDPGKLRFNDSTEG